MALVMGKYAEANTAISLAVSQVLTASCVSVAGSSDLSDTEQEETLRTRTQQPLAMPRAGLARAGMSPCHTASPVRQLQSERAGLDSFSYPSPFINQGKY